MHAHKLLSNTITNESTHPHVPQTGDNSQIGLMLAAFVMSVLGLLLLKRADRKRKADK